MRYICLFLYLVLNNTFSFCENNQLNFHVEILTEKISSFEPVAIKIRLSNDSNKNKKIHELYPNKSINIEVRKLGSKEWIQLGLFDPKSGFQFIVGDYAGYIELAPKDTISLLIGTIPWKDDGGRTAKRYYSPYQGDGDYELKLTYNLSPHNEMTSKVFKFEVNSKYDSYGGEVIKYLEGLKIPHFMYDPFTYGYYLKPNKEFSASTHSEYILSNFGKSVYAAWTKLYMIESGQSQDSKRELKELSEYPNPLIKERAKLLLEHVKN